MNGIGNKKISKNLYSTSLTAGGASCSHEKLSTRASSSNYRHYTI